MIVELGESIVRIRVGGRIVTMGGETKPDGPDGPDFVVHLDTIEHWDSPHQNLPLSLDDIRKITEVAEYEFEARGLSVEFE